MRSNKVAVTVIFNNNLSDRFMTTPVFLSLFDRIAEVRSKKAIAGNIYTFNTNHSHKGEIERMYMNFSCVQSVTFTKL